MDRPVRYRDLEEVGSMEWRSTQMVGVKLGLVVGWELRGKVLGWER